MFIVIVTAAIVFVLDVAFDALNNFGINRLKSAIKNSTTTEQNITDNETNEKTTNEIAENENLVEATE